MSDHEQEKTLIEAALDRAGLSADEWRISKDDDRPEAVVGRWVVTEDNEDVSLYEDDEGELTCSCVGAHEYGNLRAQFYLKLDEREGGEEVTPFEGIEPANG